MAEDARAQRRPLTRHDVVRAARHLTAERGLLGWSVRDLAGSLDVSTSAVYHHVGGRDEIARRVVESLVMAFPRPDPALPWQDWFREILRTARRTLLGYPGVAHWLLMHGPAFAGATDIVDAGVAALQRAGFGERTGFAYALLFNSAVAMVAIGDDRRLHEADGPRDHAAMMADFAALVPRSPGLQVLATQLLRPLTTSPGDAEAASTAYHDRMIETLIHGLEHEP